MLLALDNSKMSFVVKIGREARISYPLYSIAHVKPFSSHSKCPESGAEVGSFEVGISTTTAAFGTSYAVALPPDPRQVGFHADVPLSGDRCDGRGRMAGPGVSVLPGACDDSVAAGLRAVRADVCPTAAASWRRRP